ncbi:uncharacterized protein [Atheta coriaria]|uniref:uncharacterized protein isoform X2 n=1 Tax=Dalotia coriaria TaxID=877792 RepID=UPI0031F35D1B
MAFKFGLLGAFLFVAAVSAVPLSNEIDGSETTTDTLKSLSKCAENGGLTGVVNCAAVRTLRSLQLLTRQPSLEILPGVTLKSDDTTSQRVGKELSDEELPANPEERADKLYELLLENSAKAISGRTLQVKLPEDVAVNVARSLEEARKKKKGGMFPFMLKMGGKLVALVPAVIAGLGLLATKALIVAKIALVLSAIVFFSSGFGGKGSSILGSLGGFGGGHGGFSGSYPYARSIDVAENAASSSNSAHDLAYSKQQ